MNQKVLSKVFIWGFLFLYLLVAGISFCHAVQFFNIGNVMWMAATLAFAFELGLALSLAAILLSDENKKNTLPWVLMIILTFVQVVGNVYSTFKYISLSDVDYYIYLQKPLLFWIEEISQETVQIIISWIIGAILPIVALFMTDMVASNMKIVYMKNDKQDSKSDDDISSNQSNDDNINIHKEGDSRIINNDNIKNNTNRQNTTIGDKANSVINTNYNNEVLETTKEFQEKENVNKDNLIQDNYNSDNDTSDAVNKNPKEEKQIIKNIKETPKTILTDNLNDQDLDRNDIPKLNISKEDDSQHISRIVPNELITSSVK